MHGTHDTGASPTIFAKDAGHAPPRLKTNPMSPKAIPHSQSIPSAVRKRAGGPVVRQRSPGSRAVAGNTQALHNLIAEIPNGAPRGSTTSHAQPSSAISRRHFLTSSHVAPASSVPSPVRAKSPPRKSFDSQRERERGGICVPPLKAVRSTSAERREVKPKRKVPNGVNGVKVRSSSAEREKERGRRQNSHSAATSSFSRPTVSAPAGVRVRSPPRAKPTTAPLLSNFRSEEKKKKVPKQRIGNGSPTNLSTSGRPEQRFANTNTKPLQNSRPQGSATERLERIRKLSAKSIENDDSPSTPRLESPHKGADKGRRSRSATHVVPRHLPTSPGASSTHSRSFTKPGRSSRTSAHHSPPRKHSGSVTRSHTHGAFARPVPTKSATQSRSAVSASIKNRSHSHDTIMKLGATNLSNSSHNFCYAVSTTMGEDFGEQQEKLNYGEGGYLMIHPGDTLNKRYSLVSRLGRGQSSTVWLAKDNFAVGGSQHQYVAIKLTRCANNVRCSSSHEVALLYYIANNTTTSCEENGSGVLLNHFEHQGRHGIHVCMVFELLGKPLDALMAHNGFRGLADVHLIKDITLSILEALAQLKEINVVHTDLKPENLMFVPPPKERASSSPLSPARLSSGATPKRVKISDFGLSFLLEDEHKKKPNGEPLGEEDYRVIRASNYVKGALIQTREYRAPEIVLGNDFNCETDIWSVACIVYEMVTGRFLFDPKSKPGVVSELSNDLEHLSEITQMIGAPGQDILDDGVNTKKLYDKSYRLRSYGDGAIHRIQDIRGSLQRHLGMDDAELVYDFIQSCLTWCPDSRPTAEECLKHPWLAHHHARLQLSRGISSSCGSSPSNPTLSTPL